MNKKYPTIIVAGGGTGGHFFPALAVAEELKSQRPKAKILFLGSGQKRERDNIKDKKISYRAIISGKLRRYWSAKNILDGFKFCLGILQSLVIMIFWRPNLVFSKGGYVAFPVVIAARILRIPVFIHESDIKIGLANKLSLRFARKIFLGFPAELYKDIPIEKSIYSGNPVRKEFIKYGMLKLSDIDYSKFGFTKNTAVILVVGGSQGAHSINKIISKILDKILSKYQIIHLCGEGDFKSLDRQRQELAEERQHRYYLASFLDGPELARAMALANLIISRAGANVLAEFSGLAKPSIIIPLSSASNDHQTSNAAIYDKEGAAVVLKETSITETSLLEIINRLLEDSQELAAMGRKAYSLANPAAAEVIVEELLTFYDR